MEVKLTFRIVKIIVNLLARKHRRAFIEACKNPELTQQQLKTRILKNSRLPFPVGPTDYQDYEGKGELTLEKPKFLETTSGSTGKKKQIPYTPSLLKSFERMFLIWADDLINHSGLDLQTGKFFMSISPEIGENSTDDRKYLSPLVSWLLSPFLVSNPNTHWGKDSEVFLLKVSQDLVRARDLEVISIWSPTYLLALMEFIETHKTKLGLKTEVIHWEELWPNLKLISCWTEAQAEKPYKKLKSFFPTVRFQGKGLLLTEAPVTIPWTDAQGNVPLLNETYLEFLDEGKEIRALHELQQGKRYSVLTGQFNGFLRYDTRDEVLVTGLYHKAPLLKFLGRTGGYSDLAGEKLSEGILRESYAHVNETFLFVPDDSATLPSYCLFLDEKFRLKAQDWEAPLLQNYHYQLARSLNQLHPLRVIYVSNLAQKYLSFFQDRGMTLGDIKERNLIYNLEEARAIREWLLPGLPSSR